MTTMHDIGVGSGLHRANQMERVYWGRSVRDALAEELRDAQAERILLVTNRSLQESDCLRQVANTLGGRLVGVFSGVTAHAPRHCALAGAEQIRSLRADRVVALGGGSVIDAAKAMAMCVRYGYTQERELEPHANVRNPDVGRRPVDAASWIRTIAVPTTLSGAEFSASAGLTDERRALKQAFVNPMMMPQAVILDPAMTLETPLALMRATGMKALDHAVERMTSVNANPYSDATSETALRLLCAELVRLGQSDDGLASRVRLQYGMFMSLAGSTSGVAVNVSHAIGHVLGAHRGIAHGQTSGIILPAVLAWNREAAPQVHARIVAAMNCRDSLAADCVRSLARRLGLPTRLSEVGVDRSEFPVLAEKTMREALLANSRKPVRGPSDVIDVLELAA